MNSRPLPWFRYYTETATDIKFTRIARECGASKAEIVGAWSIILCLAAQSPVRGKLYVTFQERFDETDISVSLCFDETKTETVMSAFVRMGMIHKDDDGAYCVTNWDKRQYEGDVSTERVRKHREKQQMKRPRNVSETPPDTESDTESESESEREEGGEVVSANDADVEPKPARRGAALDLFGAQRVIEQVTGWPAIPGNPEDVKALLGTVMDISTSQNGDTVGYLKPYYDEFRRRFPRSTKTFWLTEWAVQGVIPALGQGPPKTSTGVSVDDLRAQGYNIR